MTNTLFIGKVYHRFDELPSTNDWAADFLSKSKPPEGTVVRADSQSAGRGQFGSRWESEAGKNLTLSVVLYPTWLEVSAQFYLSMAMALALHDTVNGSRYAVHGQHTPYTVNRVPCTVKWPNDIYLNFHKVAGILIQNFLSGQHLQASVVGIGLNVNQMEFDPALPNPTSLAIALGKKFDLDAVAESLFGHLERRYLQLKSGGGPAIKAEYERHLLSSNKPARFVRSVDGSEFAGIIRGVTESGRLRIETNAGEETFEVKEVRLII